MNIILQKYFFAFILVVKATLIEEESLPYLIELQRAASCKQSLFEPSRDSPQITALNYGYKVYYVVRNYRLNWVKAYAYCRANGMFLASPSTRLESEFLTHALISKNLTSIEKKNQYWISLNDLVISKSFIWMSTGENVTYTNWHAGEPNNGKHDLGVEHCGEIWTLKNGITKWNDWLCICPQNFICEN